jgi:GAF domain-containing protein
MAVATYDDILQDLDVASSRARSVEELMRGIVSRLAQIPNFNWVGFYMIERGRAGEPEHMLVLGPFVGADTPHKRIPLNQGICGAAASTGATVVVDDVHSDPRYLACSIETKSEIVAPIRVRGRVIGELDIDSHASAAFGSAERTLVESCAELVGKFLEQHAAGPA